MSANGNRTDGSVQPARNGEQKHTGESKMAIDRVRDVEYSSELADRDDLEAAERAKQANQRQIGETH